MTISKTLVLYLLRLLVIQAIKTWCIWYYYQGTKTKAGAQF